MEVTVSLRDLFSYSIIPIAIIVLFLLFDALIIFINKISKPKIKPIEIKEPNNKASIKNKYLLELNHLLNKVQNNSITIRNSYQELSIIIRKFIFEMTGIKVQNYSLSEIKALNIVSLSTLVEEYYKPEFAYISTGDIISSINKACEVINKW